MNTTNYIRIFRGDDSDALGYQTIVGTIKTDIDLTGCKAVFRFLGFYAEFNPIPEDKKLTIVIPAQASRGFPPGVGYASLKVFDSLGKIRTFTNRIPVIVDTMTPSCGCGEFEVSFSPFPELEPLKIFIGPNADDFDQYTGFVSKIIDRASLVKYGLAILADAMSEDGGASGKAASPLAVKAAYDAIIKELVDNYYTAKQTDEAIDRVAAYYITYTAAGAAFPTYAALANATTVYSGGKIRVPTRNDYCVVLADEMHQGAEYRYIYAVAEGQTTGSWQPQFPVEGVMTVDQTVQKNSQNPVSGGGVWSMIWGALSALPTGFSSLYDWVVAQLAGKLNLSGGTMTGTVVFNNSGQENFPALDYDCGYDGRIRIHSDSSGPYIDIAQVDDKVYTRIYADKISVEDLVFGQRDVLWPRSGGFLALLSNLGIPAFASTATYAVGAKVVYDNAVWNCTTAVSTAGAWNAANWTKLFDLDTGAPASGGTKLITNGQVHAAMQGKADASAIPYSLGTLTIIDTASSEVVEGETVNYGAATLADRTANIVGVTVALDELRVTIPPAVSGKVRDFGLLVAVGLGEGTALAAPALVPVAPTGETITMMNADGEMPTLADGTTTSTGSTVLYFTEIADGTFLVKGEQIQVVA